MTPNNTIHSSTTTIDVAATSQKIDAKSQAVSLFFSDMLSQMEEDYQKSGDSIMDRMREMGSKMDGLERSISDLMHDAGLDEENEVVYSNEKLNASNGTTGIASSPIRRPPSNSSPSHKTNDVQL